VGSFARASTLPVRRFQWISVRGKGARLQSLQCLGLFRGARRSARVPVEALNTPKLLPARIVTRAPASFQSCIAGDFSHGGWDVSP
jgi:hypothetical protein